MKNETKLKKLMSFLDENGIKVHYTSKEERGKCSPFHRSVHDCCKDRG